MIIIYWSLNITTDQLGSNEYQWRSQEIFMGGAVKGSSGSRFTGVQGRGSGGEAPGRWRIFEKINENFKEN